MKGNDKWKNSFHAGFTSTFCFVVFGLVKVQVILSLTATLNSSNPSPFCQVGLNTVTATLDFFSHSSAVMYCTVKPKFKEMSDYQ